MNKNEPVCMAAYRAIGRGDQRYLIDLEVYENHIIARGDLYDFEDRQFEIALRARFRRSAITVERPTLSAHDWRGCVELPNARDHIRLDEVALWARAFGPDDDTEPDPFPKPPVPDDCADDVMTACMEAA
jgi:hypothetical protein